MGDIKKYQIKVDFIPGGGIKRSDGIIADSYDRDFYITVPIFRNIIIDDYVDVEIDPLRLEVERQLINPYFIELGFFENISSTNSIVTKSKNYGIDINK